MTKKIILPGGAGLVGQNLVNELRLKGFMNVVVIDKHLENLKILKKIQPHIISVHADLSKTGSWQRHFENADIVVILQAQIGGNEHDAFIRNTIRSTKLILSLISLYKISRVVHISSSVVKSFADDFYTNSKKTQEDLIIKSGLDCFILRPTLMFGWFDRKHLGWLARLMGKLPIFPIPGNGKFLRQPLYVRDFCKIIINCMEGRIKKGIYNISGQEKMDYIDMIHEIKFFNKIHTPTIKIPFFIFYLLLWIWGCFDSDPPFTTKQLKALAAKDEFEVIDWPNIFGVPYTPFRIAIKETFTHHLYSKVVSEF